MPEKLVYFIRSAAGNMRQSPLLCTAAIGTVAVSLTIIAFFSILFFNIEQLTIHWGRQVQIKAFLDVVPKTEVLQAWTRKIEAFPEVEKVVYVTQMQAFERFRERLGQNADLLRGLTSQILPASLEIELKEQFRSRSGIQAVVEKLRQNQNLQDLHYGQDWLERFESFVTLLKFSAGILGSFLLFATVFIVSNTIKLTLYARRDELEIMSLVGGTPLFIKTPYIFEGAFQGAFGALVALGSTYLIYQFLLKKSLVTLLFTMGVKDIVFLPLTYQLTFLLTGVFLGAVGSMVSLRKFVRIRY
ncbi:MAG: ABC transporter permease [Deltaproteobacteria bacterium]|nr:ABC transporter permease [Deltaproteobacteria bacterium]